MGRGFFAAALLLAASCSPAPAPPPGTASEEATPTPTPKPQRPKLTGLRATLEDEVLDMPDGQLQWRTFWVLSWDEFPGAESYDLQVITAEGRSPKLRSLTEPRYRIEAAKGLNPKADGFVKRDIQLALHAGQLGVTVRAHFPGDRAGAWSETFDVGTATKLK